MLGLNVADCLAAPVTHNVNVVDHAFQPQNLTVNLGDTVRWTWVDDFHNVVSGRNATALDAFDSGVLFSPSIYEVIFNRSFVKANLANFPAQMDGNYLYDYFCEPHVLMGMTGSVTVIPVATSFKAAARALESVPANNSGATGSFTMSLSADEATLSISGTHTVAGATSIEIREGGLQTAGALIATLPTDLSSAQQIAISGTQADALFEGGLYLVINSASFPQGEIRGQIVQSDGTYSIAGKVALANGTMVPNAQIDAGITSTQTNAQGRYELTVPNGVYQIKGTASGLSIADSSLVLVNGASRFNIDLAASPADAAACSSVGSGNGIVIARPLNSSTSLSYDIPLQISAAVGNTFSFSLDGETFVTRQVQSPGSVEAQSGANTLAVWPSTDTGIPICSGVSLSVTVNSALTKANAEKIKKFAKSSLKADSAKRRVLLAKITTLLQKMAKGGSKDPAAEALTNANVKAALKKAKASATASSAVFQKNARKIVQLMTVDN